MLRTVAFLAAIAMSSPAFAEPTIEATSHFGFAVEDRSSTGFRNVGGSLLYMDATHPLGQGFAVGLRTLAQGGHGATGTQYYRLETGPVATWKANDSWLLDLSLSRFEESALDAGGNPLYRSTGAAAQLGYERVWRFAPRAEGAFGGFASVHQGGVATTPAAAGGTTAAASLNQGLDHGLEMALRVAL